KEPGRTRERTVYELTDQGREALRAWARTPARLTPFKSEALVRLLITDLVGEAATRESLGALRDDIADLSARVAEMAADASSLPRREKSLRLVAGFRERLLALPLELVDEVERELS